MNRYYYLIGVSVIFLGLLAVSTRSSDVQAVHLAQEATTTPDEENQEEAEPTAEPIEELPADPTAEPIEEPAAEDASAEEPPADASETDAVSASADPLNVEIPFLDVWMVAAHADFEAEAFTHWDEDDPKEVPASCAKCHTTSGYQDYLGVDGSNYREVEKAHATGQVISCVACHNDVSNNLTSVMFPSGAEISNLGPSARCMECHQGRASSVDVVAAIDEAGLADQPDTPSEDLGFINIHYFAAAASLYGGEVSGGFEYADNLYQPKFKHVEGTDSCVDCHSPHSLEVKVEQCADCHVDVDNVEDLRDVRMQGSLRDYDGDGDNEEGIFYEIAGLQALLYDAITAYGGDVNEAAIIYDSATYPYYFLDTNGDGEADDDEINYGNAYKSWTPRLLKAAYNYQTSLKDSGAFAHNAKYHIQLLYDSVTDLNESLAEPVDMSTAHRNDAGHFNSVAPAFVRFQNEESGMAQASCAKCHTDSGLPFFIEHGVNIAQPASDSLSCTTCHNDLQEFTLHEVDEVQFPSGATVSFEESDKANNLCLNCHQGRESAFSINAAIIRAKVGDDEISEELNFINPHYFAAGATVFGSEASGAYQYNGKEYEGRFEHRGAVDTCTECHTAHQLEVQVDTCADCHDFTEIADIREPKDEDNPIDWDGDGDVTEGLAGEIATIHEQLFGAIQTYAADVVGTPVMYASHDYPYWHIDTNGNGEADEDEINRDNRYTTWTPAMLRASYNYQYVAKDPGAFAHNGKYILQIMYDSLEGLGGADAVAGMTRP